MQIRNLYAVLPLALALSAPAFAAQDIDKVNGSITVEAGEKNIVTRPPSRSFTACGLPG